MSVGSCPSLSFLSLYTCTPSERACGARVAGGVLESLLMMVWVERFPGVHVRVIDPVPSGFLTGTVVKLGEVEPPVLVEPPKLGGLDDEEGE